MVIRELTNRAMLEDCVVAWSLSEVHIEAAVRRTQPFRGSIRVRVGYGRVWEGMGGSPKIPPTRSSFLPVHNLVVYLSLDYRSRSM